MGIGQFQSTLHARILQTVRDFVHAGKWIGAVCAGPLVLQAAGVLNSRRVTCSPAVASQLTATRRLEDRVVTDGRLVTSQGPGTCFAFALAMVEHIEGAEKAMTLAQAMGVSEA